VKYKKIIFVVVIANVMFSFCQVYAGNEYGDGVVLVAPVDIYTYVLSKKSVKITWNVVNGAKHYDVYRSMLPIAAFSRIASVNSVSFIDRGLQPGQTYYYRVKAVSKNVSSKYSDYSFIILNEIVESNKRLMESRIF